MIVRFATPPPALQQGGIENALGGLRDALQGAGITVLDEPDVADSNCVHHLHGLWDSVHARLAAKLRRRGLPYVVSPHGMLEPWAFKNRAWKKKPYFHLVERHSLLGANAIFVTSEMERQHVLERLPHPQVDVLPLGCRDPRGPDREKARASLGWPEDERVLLFLSRIDPKKGLDLLLHGLAAADTAGKKLRLVIVGDGAPAYINSLHKIADQHASRLPTIDWQGAIWGEARWPYLQGADLFCLTTHSENFGIAVLEALHAGTPVLTTDGTPWRDHHAVPGITICHPEVESIRSALDRIIASHWSPTDRTALSTWATNHFSWQNLAPRYIAAYNSLHHP